MLHELAVIMTLYLLLKHSTVHVISLVFLIYDCIFHNRYSNATGLYQRRPYSHTEFDHIFEPQVPIAVNFRSAKMLSIQVNFVLHNNIVQLIARKNSAR